MRFQLLLIFFMFLSIIGNAQEQKYSYTSERTFMDPTDLVGYNFRPA